MATFRSVEQYRRVMQVRAKAIKRGAMKASSNAATFMQTNAIKMAPVHTGTTVRSIKKVKKGKNYVVESWVPGKFKQNLWANRKAPFRTINWTKGNSRFGIKAGTRGLYGVSPPHFHWTGTPRFFDLAALRTRAKFRELGRKNRRKALRVTV